MKRLLMMLSVVFSMMAVAPAALACGYNGDRSEDTNGGSSSEDSSGGSGSGAMDRGENPE